MKRAWVVFYPASELEREMYLGRSTSGSFETFQIPLAAKFETATAARKWATSLRGRDEWRIGMRP